MIFLISTAIFLSIPIFFNYEKKAEIIKLYLFENYNYKINNYERIKYNIFPLPNLEFINAEINVKTSKDNLGVKKIKIYPNLLNIYNYKNFNSNKIILIDSQITFQISKFKNISNQLFKKKKKLIFDSLNLKMIDKNIPIIEFDNIKFTNYGYSKNLIRGNALGKKFKIKIDDDYKTINFKLLNTGINADVFFNENQKENFKHGIFKFKILNINFKSNFEYDGKVINIYNSYFRSKNLSFKNKGEIILNPFLDINSKFFIEEFNFQILRQVDFIKLFKLKDFLRKINNRSEINYKSKKFNRKFFDDFNLKINLAYGRINFSKRLSSPTLATQCDGDINLLEEYPVLVFDCHVKSENKKELLKKFSIKTKNKNEIFELKVKGNLSIFNRKINFKNITVNDSYNASTEDLKYFKSSFENILFDENFLEIFNLKKIKNFIIEVS
tara:strand:+ start:1872 stop:3194 length:1323 start_codon:yes stop_codon:yes gene_type:complete